MGGLAGRQARLYERNGRKPPRVGGELAETGGGEKWSEKEREDGGEKGGGDGC